MLVSHYGSERGRLDSRNQETAASRTTTQLTDRPYNHTCHATPHHARIKGVQVTKLPKGTNIYRFPPPRLANGKRKAQYLIVFTRWYHSTARLSRHIAETLIIWICRHMGISMSLYTPTATSRSHVTVSNQGNFPNPHFHSLLCYVRIYIPSAFLFVYTIAWERRGKHEEGELVSKVALSCVNPSKPSPFPLRSWGRKKKSPNTTTSPSS